MVTRDHLSYEDTPIQRIRASLDMLQGRYADALARCDALAAVPNPYLSNRIEFAESAATVELWCGRPGTAWDRLKTVLREAMETDVSAESSGALALAARAAADVANTSTARPSRIPDLLTELRELHSSARHDPFGPSPVFAARPAQAAAWKAECARLAGRPSLELWAEAARQWERLGRSHDAGYSRWRGAQVALASGQRTVALRLLRRAAREAREHVPLSSAVVATAGQAPTHLQPSDLNEDHGIA
jgi:hypothetical protein